MKKEIQHVRRYVSAALMLSIGLLSVNEALYAGAQVDTAVPQVQSTDTSQLSPTSHSSTQHHMVKSAATDNSLYSGVAKQDNVTVESLLEDGLTAPSLTLQEKIKAAGRLFKNKLYAFKNTVVKHPIITGFAYLAAIKIGHHFVARQDKSKRPPAGGSPSYNTYNTYSTGYGSRLSRSGVAGGYSYSNGLSSNSYLSDDDLLSLGLTGDSSDLSDDDAKWFKKEIDKARAQGTLNMRGSDGLTLLHNKIWLGTAQEVRMLIQAGVDATVASTYVVFQGYTPLHLACHCVNKRAGGSEKVAALLALDTVRTHINAKDKDGNTALMLIKNNSAVARMLINAGADIDIKDDNNQSALVRAIDAKDVEMVRCLCEVKDQQYKKSGNANNIGDRDILHDVYGDTEQHAWRTADDIKKSEEILKIVLSCDWIDMDSKDRHGRTVLLDAITANRLDIVKMLCAKGVAVNQLNINVRFDNDRTVVQATPLIWALLSDNHDIFNNLLSVKNIDIGVQDSAGNTVLHHCVKTIGVDRKQENHSGLITQKNMLATLIVHIQRTQKYKMLNTGNHKGHTVLHEAVLSGDRDVVRSLIALKADINQVDAQGNTALMVACDAGSVEMMEELLKKNKDGSVQACLDVVNKQGKTVLCLADKLGRVPENTKRRVDLLLQAGANYAVQQGDGWNLLAYAVKIGDKDLVACLLAAEVSPNQLSMQTVHGDTITPLMWAVINNKEDMFNLLIDKADSTVRDGSGDTVLHHLIHSINATDAADMLAIQRNWLVRILNKNQSSSAFIDIKNEREKTALYLAACGGDADTVRSLIQYGADMREKTKKLMTPLMAACCHGHLGVVKELLAVNAGYTSFAKTVYDQFEQLYPNSEGGGADALALVTAGYLGGVDVNAVNADGFTALYYAANEGFDALPSREQVVQLLIDAGADVNRIYRDCWSVLSYAVTNNNKDMVKQLLLDKKIEVDIDDVLTLLQSAEKDKKDQQILQLLYNKKEALIADFFAVVEAGYAVDSKEAAYVNDFLRCFRVDYVLSSADIEHKDRLGNTLLHKALKGGHKKAAALLIEQGEYTLIREANGNFQDALMLASQHGYADTVWSLLQKNADVVREDMQGITALQYAAQGGHAQIVKTLLEHKASAHGGSAGVPPLTSAARKGCANIVQLLLGDTCKESKENPCRDDACTHRADSCKEYVDSASTGDQTHRYIPLTYASQQGHGAVVQVLIEKMQKIIHTKRKNALSIDQTAWDVATSKGYVKKAFELALGHCQEQVAQLLWPYVKNNAPERTKNYWAGLVENSQGQQDSKENLKQMLLGGLAGNDEPRVLSDVIQSAGGSDARSADGE